MKKGKWICYPGDFEIFLAERVCARRYQREVLVMPFWRVDSPWHNVKFVAEFTVPEDTQLFVKHEGDLSIFMEGPNKYLENFSGTVDLKKGRYKIHFWVYHPDGLPSICIDGDYFCSDGNMFASYDQYHLIPAEEVGCGEMTPNTWRLPRREIGFKSQQTSNGAVYDFGRIFMGFVRFDGCENSEFRCYFGETKAEAMSDSDCEQILSFSPKDGKYEDRQSRAFRYLRVVTDSPYTLSAEEEYNPKKAVFSLRTADKKLEEIAKTADYTFSVCDREFYLDGAKRDRWLWEGDAYQAFRMEYYRSGDFAAIRRSIVALFGKSPVTAYINHIMDYTLYAIQSVWEYYEHSGDVGFLKRIYPICKEHMDFVCSRTGRGVFLQGMPGDWVFVDWNSDLDTEGELSFEQILFYLALEAFGKICKVVGVKAEKYRRRAKKLRFAIDEVFWDEERGVYRHSRKDGKVGEEVTAYANIFAVLCHFAEGKKREKIKKALRNDPDIPPIKTPYMQTYKLSCLFELGEYEEAVKEIYGYWGGMIDAGAKTFWEYYEPGDADEPPRSMYGRKFGMSRCHIWGASVLYLIPRYFYGIRTDCDCGRSFEMRPNLSLVQNSELSVALGRGYLSVCVDGGMLRIFSSEIGGTLYIGAQEYRVAAGESLEICLGKDRNCKGANDISVDAPIGWHKPKENC